MFFVLNPIDFGETDPIKLSIECWILSTDLIQFFIPTEPNQSNWILD